MLMTLLFFAFLFIVGLLTTLLNLPTKKFTSMVLQSFFSQKTPAQTTNKAPTMAHKNKAIKKSGGSSSTKNKGELELKGIFATFDMNKDGFITKQELSESLKNIGMSVSERDVVEIVEKADFNKDGLIDFEEFCELMAIQDQEEMTDSSQSGDRELLGGGKVKEEEDVREGDLKEAFDVFDGDRDGLITVDELGLVLKSMGFKEGKRVENCKEMIRQVDKDGDGMVNFDEFKCMMRSGTCRLMIPVS